MSAPEGGRGAGAAHARDMPFWGWGRPEQERTLPAHALAALREELGASEHAAAPAALDEVRLGEPALPEGVRDRLATIVGPDALRDDRAARVRNCRGKSYPDLIRQRAGECEAAPDAVVLPQTHEQVRTVLELCSAERVAVVPFGGGTSVVGGLEPLREGFAGLISLDLDRLDRVLRLDEASRTVRVEGGLRAPEAEALLAPAGWTIGHVPQSYEFVTLGGCVATRSAGQASTGYGRIDELVVGLRAATPAGDIDLGPLPATAAGPDVEGLIVGSEGTLGVLTEVELSMRPLPERRRYEGWFFRSWEEGCAALRACEHARVAPDVARLSDEEETRLQMMLAGREGLKNRLADSYLRARRYAGGCLALAGWEGTAEDVSRRRAQTVAVLRAHGGIVLGQSPGRSWERNRFLTPYLRDDMIARGLFVETLETATEWGNLQSLYRAVGDTLREALGSPAMVMCHVSHLYPSGASLYFSFLSPARAGEEIEQWREVKGAACEAIVEGGGTITHHHAVGTDHAPWLPREIGELGIAALRGAKERLDPAGIMNPGKLLG